MVENMLKNPKRENPDKIEQEFTKKRKIIDENSSNRGTRMVKLYCPAVSKITEIIAWEEQRLDLGAIARTFGLEPATIKLNGHFISRGVDLMACSVTWKSLLNYFSSKNLSTGVGSSPALVVDGKLSKPGSKRAHETTEYDRGGGVDRHSDNGEISSPNIKKFKENNNALDRDSQSTRHCDSGLKRRHWVEDSSPFKKVRVRGSYTDEDSLGHAGSKGSCSAELRSGYQMSGNMKRRREDEVVMAAFCKRTR